MPSLGVNVAIIRSRQILLTEREDFEVWFGQPGPKAEKLKVGEAGRTGSSY